MKRSYGTTRRFGIAAVMVFVLAFAGVALASGDSTRGRGYSDRTITVFGKTVQLKLIDLGDAGFSLGDQTVFSDDLLTKANGRPVGSDGGVCTLVRVADAATLSGTVQCQVAYALKGGQITAQALVPLTNGGFIGKQAAAITGGTGRFRTAHGKVTLEFAQPGEVHLTIAVQGGTR